MQATTNQVAQLPTACRIECAGSVPEPASLLHLAAIAQASATGPTCPSLSGFVVGARPVEPAVAQDRAAGPDHHVLEVIDRLRPLHTSSGSSSVLTHPPLRTPFMLAWPCATTWATPVASAAASRCSVPSLRSRLVVAKKRSALLRLGLPPFRPRARQVGHEGVSLGHMVFG
jgi:hypothetical protein